jgi:Hint domain
MSRPLRIDRARRNALKATTLVLGAILATGAGRKQASAQSQPAYRPTPVPTPVTVRSGSCFARGTQIRTREGDRPIETLAAGDEVAVRFGGFAPIKAMVSHTLNSVSGKWVGEAKSNLPVLLRRGALGEHSPNADLHLTGEHAVYVDGYLIKVGDLVNGTSIIFEAADGRDTLDFFNIELDHHDILDVQGAFCETLWRAGTERCAPLGFTGGRSKLRSHLRSVASLVVDRRQPIDIIRDNLEERGLDFARAA